MSSDRGSANPLARVADAWHSRTKHYVWMFAASAGAARAMLISRLSTLLMLIGVGMVASEQFSALPQPSDEFAITGFSDDDFVRMCRQDLVRLSFADPSFDG